MGTPAIFMIRLVLGLVLALLISGFFLEGASVAKVTGLAAILVGLAYLFEHARKRDKGGEKGN